MGHGQARMDEQRPWPGNVKWDMNPLKSARLRA
jgi:hypothetical protein